MAVNFKPYLAICVLVAMAGACAPAPEVAPTNQTPLSFQDESPQADLETIAVLTPLEPETHDLWSALVLELHDDFNIVTVPVNKHTGPGDLARELNRTQPRCVIVVDNRTLQLYRTLQGMLPEREFPPAVVVMTSFLEKAIHKLRRATGIVYEAPAVSSIVALRELTDLKLKRVGVIYRKTFTSVVSAQAKLIAVEKVQLVPFEVADSPSPADIEDALDSLVVDQKVDALWVLNDNQLLTSDLIASSWLPVLRFKPVPVIVGVSALVHPDIHFGTLAVIPHPARLGVQTANLVFDLADNDWQLTEDGAIELPLSVTTVVDVEQMNDYFGLKRDALAQIDEARE